MEYRHIWIQISHQGLMSSTRSETWFTHPLQITANGSHNQVTTYLEWRHQDSQSSTPSRCYRRKISLTASGDRNHIHESLFDTSARSERHCTWFYMEILLNYAVITCSEIKVFPQTEVFTIQPISLGHILHLTQEPWRKMTLITMCMLKKKKNYEDMLLFQYKYVFHSYSERFPLY